jgi:hypothetical protein
MRELLAVLATVGCALAHTAPASLAATRLAVVPARAGPLFAVAPTDPLRAALLDQVEQAAQEFRQDAAAEAESSAASSAAIASALETAFVGAAAVAGGRSYLLAQRATRELKQLREQQLREQQVERAPSFNMRRRTFALGAASGAVLLGPLFDALPTPGETNTHLALAPPKAGVRAARADELPPPPPAPSTVRQLGTPSFGTSQRLGAL